ncbi:adenylosuccinate lyase [soil metagenome]
MSPDPLTALSPLDGRYAASLHPLRDIFSELGLIRRRIEVEISWLEHLAAEPGIGEFDASPARRIADRFGIDDARRIKQIEASTKHDVKAVEYFIRERLQATDAPLSLRELVHFGCTSEDINNLAYALMLSHARDEVLVPAMRDLIGDLDEQAAAHADLPMLSRTHGQPATPTTLGKELANFGARLERQLDTFVQVVARGKMNGAVGNFNAHMIAYPELDWPDIAERYVRSLGLEWNPYTTQIEPHDWLAEYCDALARCDVVLIDFCRDMWGYIALGYFRQRAVDGEVGSSTMPHKVNPIDFENAEGNLGIGNALLAHFSAKLPVSRWQRDLTDSTVLRSVGVALGHVMLALLACRKGLARLVADEERLQADLNASWEVLAEAIQTVMRRYAIDDGYEQLKMLTRGARIEPRVLHEFIATLEVPEAAKCRLLELTPAAYIGTAARQAHRRTRSST